MIDCVAGRGVLVVFILDPEVNSSERLVPVQQFGSIRSAHVLISIRAEVRSLSFNNHASDTMQAMVLSCCTYFHDYTLLYLYTGPYHIVLWRRADSASQPVWRKLQFWATSHYDFHYVYPLKVKYCSITIGFLR